MNGPSPNVVQFRLNTMTMLNIIFIYNYIFLSSNIFVSIYEKIIMAKCLFAYTFCGFYVVVFSRSTFDWWRRKEKKGSRSISARHAAMGRVEKNVCLRFTTWLTTFFFLLLKCSWIWRSKRRSKEVKKKM